MERLEKLERQNRALKLVGLSALLLIAGSWIIGQVRPKRLVTAEEFVLIDAKQRARAKLFIEDGVRPMLALLDENGARPTYFASTPTGPVLRLGNRSGEEIMLAVGGESDSESNVFIEVSDRNGFKTLIGKDRTKNETTNVRPPSAASVVLSKGPSLGAIIRGQSEDRKALWSAP
jgi:hypothetical protein